MKRQRKTVKVVVLVEVELFAAKGLDDVAAAHRIVQDILDNAEGHGRLAGVEVIPAYLPFIRTP